MPKVYLAGPIFTERDRDFNTKIEAELLKRCPGMDLYLAQNNKSINDKTGCATSADIYVGDVRRLKAADMVITIMSGDTPPIGSSYECAYYTALCEQDETKQIIALYDDCREGFHTYSDAKRDAMLSGIAENQWPYINLLAVGFVKRFGKICFTSKEFIDEIVKQYNIISSPLKSGIYKITNLANGTSYVGQTIDLHSCYLQHFGLFGDEKDLSSLHEDMKKYGKEYFKYEILEKCEAQELDEREKYWIDHYGKSVVRLPVSTFYKRGGK